MAPYNEYQADTNENVMDTVTSRDYAAQDANFANRLRTVDSVTIPREVFEVMYSPPQRRTRGILRSTFGNPFPMYVHV